MTVLRPGEHADELISASLTGDLTDAERAALDQHLAGCARCQETLAAFREERRLISGMRHLQAPADLGARVRTGIESGASGSLPWWQRRSTLIAMVGSLGAVAAGLLAVVVLSNMRPPPVADQTASPSASMESSFSQAPSAPVSIAATPSAVASTTPVPQPSIDPNPVGRLRYTVDRQQPRLEVATKQGEEEIQIDRYGTPIDVALSPDGDWLAFRVMGEGSGLIDTYAYRTADGEVVQLSAMGENSPFSRLAWSPDGSMLAFTGGTGDLPYPLPVDVWIFYADAAEPITRQLTSTGAGFAADFYGTSGDDNLLWVSVAGSDPVTYGIAVGPDPVSSPVDPADVAIETHPGAFLPVHNGAAGTAAVLWRGQMSADGGGGWNFAHGGMLYLAEADRDGHFADLGSVDQQVFDTLAIPPGGEAFSRARFAWAPDGDGLAVWDAWWAGVPEAEGFPDETRVYFGHPLDGILIGPLQALDVGDTAGGSVVQVSLAGGPYLALTVVTKEGSEGGSFGPTAELRLVTRNVGSVPDEVQTFGTDKVWNGPAIYPAVVDQGK